MAQDPILRLAKLRAIKASADLEVQLSNRTGSAPTIEILRLLRDRAAESLAALAVANPEKPEVIRVLQNEVMKYDEWVAWMKEVISTGITYDKEFTEEERDETLDMLMTTPEGQRQAIELGLIDGGALRD